MLPEQHSLIDVEYAIAAEGIEEGCEYQIVRQGNTSCRATCMLFISLVRVILLPSLQLHFTTDVSASGNNYCNA